MSESATRDRPESRGDLGGARARILARVRTAAATRGKLPHPGRLEPPAAPAPAPAPTTPSAPAPAPNPAPDPATSPDPATTFVKRFTSQGGQVAIPDPNRPARDWLTSFLERLGDDATTIAIGADVPTRLQPRPPNVPPAHADVGISLAWGAVAETGSLILPSTGTRAVQLLPPVHIIWVPAGRVFARLEDALLELRAELPAGVGLHSGPSKSADIGQTVVTGVHGPGRCIAVLES